MGELKRAYTNIQEMLSALNLYKRGQLTEFELFASIFVHSSTNTQLVIGQLARADKISQTALIKDLQDSPQTTLIFPLDNPEYKKVLEKECSTFCAPGEPCSISHDGVCDVEVEKKRAANPS